MKFVQELALASEIEKTMKAVSHTNAKEAAPMIEDLDRKLV